MEPTNWETDDSTRASLSFPSLDLPDTGDGSIAFAMHRVGALDDVPGDPSLEHRLGAAIAIGIDVGIEHARDLLVGRAHEANGQRLGQRTPIRIARAFV